MSFKTQGRVRGSRPGHSERPGGGPRGLLRVCILNMIAVKPRHGYEIIQDIQDKTEGAWNPGAGSIYPVLKKLVSEGHIEAETPGAVDDRHVYHITPKGARHVAELREAFANFGQRWSAMRSLIMEMVAPENVEKFVLEGARKQFEFTREFVKSKVRLFEQTEIEYMLKEYALDLERQLNWVNQSLADLKTRPVVQQRKQKERI